MSTRLSDLRRDVEAADVDIIALQMELAREGQPLHEWVPPPPPEYGFDDSDNTAGKGIYQSHIECYNPAFLKVASTSGDVDSQVGAIARLEEAARGRQKWVCITTSSY